MWHRTQKRFPDRKTPIIVLFGWLGARNDLLLRYASLYNSLGCDVFRFKPPQLSLWFPYLALRNALYVLDSLLVEVQSNGWRPILFANFSGSPKACYYKVLQVLSGRQGLAESAIQYAVIRFCVCGEIFDSSPIDYTSDHGVRALSAISKGNALYKSTLDFFLNSAACGLDFIFLERFEAERADYWSTMRSSCAAGPVLFLYSTGDEILPVEIVKGFVRSCRRRGREVWEKCWRNSGHVAHFKAHPDEYGRLVNDFVSRAVYCWTNRTASQGLHSSASELSLVPRSKL